jgi:N-acyl-D-aspartate/D-glutamate deacylase
MGVGNGEYPLKAPRLLPFLTFHMLPFSQFPEYLDALANRHFACDVAVMVGHGGVRTWVLGKRANVSDRPGGPEKDPVTDKEIESMAAVVREAVAAGALGFSTSRLLLHRDNRGILTPGCLAAKKEMLRICDAVTEGGGGIFEMSADFSAYDDIPYHKLDATKRAEFFKSELGWMAEAMAKHQNLKVTFGIGPQGAKFFSKWASKVASFPGQCVLQFQTRPQSFHMSHASGKNPFSSSVSYRKARKEAAGETSMLISLLKGEKLRAAILEEMSQFKSMGSLGQGLVFENYKNDLGAIVPVWMISGDMVYPWCSSYEPTQDTMVANTAAAAGTTALEACYDILMDTDGPHAGVAHTLYTIHSSCACRCALAPPLWLRGQQRHASRRAGVG